MYKILLLNSSTTDPAFVSQTLSFPSRPELRNMPLSVNQLKIEVLLQLD